MKATKYLMLKLEEEMAAEDFLFLKKIRWREKVGSFLD